ncbi:glycosyl transferase, family 2 [endosymbiont of Riftia pachyptila (vent Ph05)]|nr:glycosyl transferase, family 2 [endosymbiont of Riftia pachyptila (vent Ph05)]
MLWSRFFMISSASQLSVIIPAIDEEDALPLLLKQLWRQQDIELELILADGGSRDSTLSIASAHGVRIVATDAGRGRQMNAGAAVSSSPFLLFLHADSGLTDERQLADALAALKQAMQARGQQRIAGHFRLSFCRSRPGQGFVYHYYEEKSALNRPECTNGDQGFLLPSSLFDELGGFDESLWFLEDQRLAETIRSKGEWITLPGTLETSARRFEQEGLGRRMILSALIMNFHAIGLDAFFERVAAVYRNQSQTGQLQLAPIFRLIDALNREAGSRVARHRWLASGRYVRGHAWQLFFLFDLVLQRLLGGRRRPGLWLHDRVFRPLTDFMLFDWLTAGLAWLWFHASWRLFRRLERGQTGRD